MPRCIRRARMAKLALNQPVLARAARASSWNQHAERAVFEGGMCAEVELRWDMFKRERTKRTDCPPSSTSFASSLRGDHRNSAAMNSTTSADSPATTKRSGQTIAVCGSDARERANGVRRRLGWQRGRVRRALAHLARDARLYVRPWPRCLAGRVHRSVAASTLG